MVLDTVTVLSIPSRDGVVLEATIQHSEEADRAIVLCHPHPQHGGTMRHPLLGAIANAAVPAGIEVLRFNFRGIGASTGAYDSGVGEIDDVAAAVGFMESRDLPVTGIAGWSFGAAAALAWQGSSGSAIDYVGIAPPVDSPLTPELPDASSLARARRTFIVGDRDQFVDADGLEAYADAIGATTIRYETADHFFVLREKKLAADVIGALKPEVNRPA